ncbi:MAG: hypothetical protein KAI81_09175, partial [Candidatus Marinimicrobia bacterium]|nr:hypothetical protein [Candidatus Neomarinimicrobiota bacterium]
EDFSDENILYSSMDKKIDLTFFDNELWLFLPGESSIYIFNQNGQLSETYEIPPTLSNTQCLFHPFQAYKVILYCQDNLVLYNLKTKKQKKITAMGLNWSFIYHRELYLSEGIDNFKIRNITLRF